MDFFKPSRANCLAILSRQIREIESAALHRDPRRLILMGYCADVTHNLSLACIDPVSYRFDRIRAEANCFRARLRAHYQGTFGSVFDHRPPSGSSLRRRLFRRVHAAPTVEEKFALKAISGGLVFVGNTWCTADMPALLFRDSDEPVPELTFRNFDMDCDFTSLLSDVMSAAVESLCARDNTGLLAQLDTALASSHTSYHGWIDYLSSG